MWLTEMPETWACLQKTYSTSNELEKWLKNYINDRNREGELPGELVKIKPEKQPVGDIHFRRFIARNGLMQSRALNTEV